MKKILALLVICCMLMTTLASCDLVDKIKDLINPPAPHTECVDADGDYVCDVCGKELEKPEPPVCEEHKDEDGDEKCDACGADVPKPQPPACTEHKDEDGDEKCDACGADVPKPQPPACTEHKDEDGDYKCDSCDTVMFEEVKYTFNVSDVEAGTRTEDDVNGKFTIVSGTEVRNRTKSYEGVEYTKSVKFGSNNNAIRVSVPGSGTLRFIVQNGSSSATVQYVKITDPSGAVSQIEIPGTTEGNPTYMVELEVTEGEWTIQRVSGTIDVYYLELECVVAVAPENGFELVSEGTASYLTGDTLDVSKVRLNATYENGKTDSLDLSLVNIDVSKVDMSKEGVYDITITYKDYDPITYQVSVYAPSEIKLGFDAIEKLASNSSAGNGVYFNHSFKELYLVGEELDTAGLTVIVTAKCGDKSLEFKVDDYEITGFDSSEWGEKTLTITANGVSATTNVYVSYSSEIVAGEDGIIRAMVDPNYQGPRGAKVGDPYTFSTIQQALDFLAHADAATPKHLNICVGLYNEKIEITIPNLTIYGDDPTGVVIEWDSIYGQLDASGFSHVTDSTATVAVRESAVNCVIENLTISNYWNTQERMDEAGLAIERNLALLVQADRFIMKNGALLAIQDTLELFTGRQYFENVFISGYTDFIFGTNNTTYFKNCTIHTIDTVKDDQGTAGYLTAFKGSNKGSGDSVVYGAIFDGCKFTADEGVMEGKTAIGRTWGAYAAVAVINSEIGGHISLDGYDSSENKNKRYISMNGIHPTDETVQFVEYNNTGAGAISEAVAGMRMLTAEEAALYADFATIFGTKNGNVTYLDPWDPNSDEVVEDDRDYYYFTTETSTTGTNHSFDTTTTIAKGATLEWDGLLISAENGSVAWNQNSGHLNMKKGAYIKFTVPAGTTVIVKAYSASYNFFTLNGVGTTTDTLSQYYADETEVTLLSTGDLYLAYIIIDPNSEAPEEPTLTGIKVSGMKVEYMVGDEISLDGVSVSAVYSDNSVRSITDYSVDSSAVNNAEAGEYAVVFKSGDLSASVTVTYLADMLISETTTIDLSATGANIQKTTGTYKQLTIDATNGKFADNGSGWVQVNTGTVITIEVLDGAEVSVVAYSSADNFDIFVGNGVCTITATANDYLKSITVKYVVVYGENTTIDLSATGANIQKTTGTYEGLTVDATNGKFADNNGGWVQVNAGTVITLNVLDGAQVSVTAYSSADNFDIVVADGVCTITCVANDYLKAITVKYEVVYGENTTIDLSATGANIQKTTGTYEGLTVDATNGKFADNNGGWTQVNAGTVITLNVLDGAQVSVTAYSSADNFDIVVADGVCTITCVANDYLCGIVISY